MDYETLIARKAAAPAFDSIAPAKLNELSPAMFPHQRDLVAWALRKGRAAIFADTGLGKTRMELEWARHVVAHGGRVLILAPLAVAEQTVREAHAIGMSFVDYRRQDDGASDVVVTNYEMLPHFDPANFAGVVLDESSILKNFNGRTRDALIAAFADTAYKLAATATPAPNDFTELGNHAEFLGVKSRTEMLAEYFVHDGGDTGEWRLKGHAEDAFWRWVCTWGALVKTPADLGHDGSMYSLPPLTMHEVVIHVDHKDAHAAGFLFAQDAVTLQEQRATRRATMEKRVAAAVKLADTGEPVIIWGELNDECNAVEAAIGADCVQVKGSDSPDAKRDSLLAFAEGRIRVLVSKPSICGFGLNWQHCDRMIFLGASHSYEQTYQAIRRCWRFGQKWPVAVSVIRADTEGPVMANYNRKAADAARFSAEMSSRVNELVRAEVACASAREWNAYDPQKPQHVPAWIGQECAA